MATINLTSANTRTRQRITAATASDIILDNTFSIGDFVEIVALAGSAVLTVKNNSGTVLTTLTAPSSARFIRSTSTVWDIDQFGGSGGGGGSDPLKANLASPALTGIPTAPTATSGTNTTQIATTAFTTTAIAAATSGSSATRATKVLQSLVSRASNTLAFNPYSGRPAPVPSALPTIAPIASIDAGFTRSYSATTGGLKPWNYLGGDPVVNGFGVNLMTSQWTASVRQGLTGWIEFLLDGSSCNILLEAGFGYRFLVEDEGIMKYVPDANVTLASGSGQQYYRLSFTGTRPRHRIMIELNSGGDPVLTGRFGGLWVAVQSQIMRPAAPDIRAICIGDSNIMGVNGPPANSHARVAHAHLGINDLWISANHSTGSVQTHAGALKWGQRRTDWLDHAPDILNFYISWIDLEEIPATPLATVVSTIMAEINAARAAFPNLIIMVYALLWSAEEFALDSRIQQLNSGVKTAIINLNNPLTRFVETLRTTETSITGRGNAGATTGTGNADIYIGVNDHWSDAGDIWAGTVHAQTMVEELTKAYYGIVG